MLIILWMYYWASFDNKKLLYFVYYNTNRCAHNPKICVCVDQVYQNWSTQTQISTVINNSALYK